eukprot:CFRG1449T1
MSDSEFDGEGSPVNLRESSIPANTSGSRILENPYRVIMFDPVQEWKQLLLSGSSQAVFALGIALWAIGGWWFVILAALSYGCFQVGLKMGSEQNKGNIAHPHFQINTNGVFGSVIRDDRGSQADSYDGTREATLNNYSAGMIGVLNINPANVRYIRTHMPLCIDPELDMALRKVFSLLLRDFLLSWFGKLTSDDSFVEECNMCFETAIMKLEALVVGSDQDIPTLVTNRMFHAFVVHLREFKDMETTGMSSERYFETPKGQAYLHFAARSPENERRYLRQLAELVTTNLLPVEECNSACTRTLVREILVSQCLAPGVSSVSDPDFINRQIINWFPPSSLYAARVQQQLTKTPVKLLVKVCQMRNFVSHKPGEISEPYCTVRYDGEPRSTSKVAWKTTPRWDEQFTFIIHKGSDNLNTQEKATFGVHESQTKFDPNDLFHPVHVRVYDWDIFRTDVLLGTVIVPLDSLPANRPRTEWYTLLTPRSTTSTNASTSSSTRKENYGGVIGGGSQAMALRLEMTLTMSAADAETWHNVTLTRAEMIKRSKGGAGMVRPPRQHRSEDNMHEHADGHVGTSGELSIPESSFSSGRRTSMNDKPNTSTRIRSMSMGMSSYGAATNATLVKTCISRASSESVNLSMSSHGSEGGNSCPQSGTGPERSAMRLGSMQYEVNSQSSKGIQLSFDEILTVPASFLHFMEFMESEGAGSLLQFWVNANNYMNYSESADEKKKVGSMSRVPNNTVPQKNQEYDAVRIAKQKQQLHQQQQLEAFSIFTMHFSSGAPFPVPVSQDVIRKMEKALKDSITGPTSSVFEEAQIITYRNMKRRYYPKFRHSLIYRKFLESRDGDTNEPAVGETLDPKDIYSHRRSGSNSSTNSNVETHAHAYSHMQTPTLTSTSIKEVNEIKNTGAVGAGVGAGAGMNVGGCEKSLVDVAIHDDNAHKAIENTIVRSDEVEHISSTSIPIKIISESPIYTPKGMSESESESYNAVGVGTMEDMDSNVSESENESERIGVSMNRGVGEEDGHNAIGAAIALMKEQQLVIEDLINSSQPGSKHYKDLVKQQETLSTELAQLMAMGLMNKDEEVISGLTVEVASVELECQGENMGKIVYVIEVSQYMSGKFKSGWMLTKEYDNLADLYTKLSLHFAKVKQIPFPPCPKRDIFNQNISVGSSVLSLNKHSGHSKREEKKEQNRKSMNSVLNMLLLDELLYRSKPLQDFLKPDNVDEKRVESAKLVQIQIAAKSNMSRLREQQIELTKQKNNQTAMRVATACSPLEAFMNSKSSEVSPHSDSTALPSAKAPDSLCASDLEEKASTNSLGSASTVTQNVSGIRNTTPTTRKSSISSPLSHTHPSPLCQSQPAPKDDGNMWTEIVFGLIDEVFELNSRNKWLRRKAVSIMTGVLQNMHGASINKTIRDNIRQLFSLQQIVYTVNLFRETFWPDDIYAIGRVRTEEEKDSARLAAQEALMSSIPDFVESMVGRYNCTLGFTKVFNAAQNKQMNKHLIYVAIDSLVLSILSQRRSQTTDTQ